LPRKSMLPLRPVRSIAEHKHQLYRTALNKKSASLEEKRTSRTIQQELFLCGMRCFNRDPYVTKSLSSVGEIAATPDMAGALDKP
jgi:hypothetical protein